MDFAVDNEIGHFNTRLQQYRVHITIFWRIIASACYRIIEITHPAIRSRYLQKQPSPQYASIRPNRSKTPIWMR